MEASMVELMKKYLVDNVLILIPVLYYVGYLLKQSQNIPDKYIPWIITVVSIVFTICILGINVNSVIQGFLVAGATIMVNNYKKQLDKPNETLG